MTHSEPSQAAMADLIANALREIRFGSVEITIHDARVVQIERREKLRIDPAGGQGRKD